jgi:hypothetical protein
MASDELAAIVRQQRRWAGARGIPIDERGRTVSLDGNLFAPPHPDTHREFEAGAGNELGGDLRSLRSSAALACNVFDYWRRHPSEPVAQACGLGGSSCRVSFERKFPTGLGGTPPHLDVVLEPEEGPPTAIESKFSELYGTAHNDFRKSYFTRQAVWEGLPHSLDLAHRIRDGDATFQALGAAQLLKHALGLKQAYGPRGFRLLYLWYEVPGETAKLHQKEVDDFARQVADDFVFDSLTYQELFPRLQETAAEHQEYLDYLGARYFGR